VVLEYIGGISGQVFFIFFGPPISRGDQLQEMNRQGMRGQWSFFGLI
jgi:hypothetical protein